MTGNQLGVKSDMASPFSGHSHYSIPLQLPCHLCSKAAAIAAASISKIIEFFPMNSGYMITTSIPAIGCEYSAIAFHRCFILKVPFGSGA